MAFVSADSWKELRCQDVIDDYSPKFFLFEDNITPDGSETFGGLTEPTASGYARQTATASSPSVTAHVAKQVYDTATFPAMDADVTVYGYGLVDNAGSQLIGVEAFSGGPITIPAGTPFPLSFTYKYGNCS